MKEVDMEGLSLYEDDIPGNAEAIVLVCPFCTAKFEFIKSKIAMPLALCFYCGTPLVRI